MLPMRRGVDDFFAKLSARNLFIFLFIYQCLFIVQGLDFTDEGFHATFYEQIYNDPQSVQYNFMYWFSGIIGGAWVKLFGGMGLLGIRLAGVFVVTGTAILVYNFLKRYCDPKNLKIALFILVLFSSNDPKELYYNNLSALFYVLIAWTLVSGLRKNNSLLLIISGALVAVNTLTRLPNILELGLGLTIIYAGYLNKLPVGRIIGQCLLFGAGFIAGFAALAGIMMAIGHWQILMDAVGLLVKLGKSEEGLAEAASKDSSSYYGLMTQIKMFWGNYSISLRYVLLTGALLLAMGSFAEHIRKLLRKRWIYQLLKALLIVAATIIILSGGKMNNTPNIILLYFFTGLGLVITFMLLLSRTDKWIKILAFTGCYLMVAYPVGSSSGILTAGLYSFWIIFPVIVNKLFEINHISFTLRIGYENSQNGATFPLGLTPNQYSGLKNILFLLAVAGCLWSAWYYPMHNARERHEMVYGVNSPKLRGVLTDRERATAVNELLAALQPVVKKNDYLLAHDALPMIHYLTGTRPFLGNSYPWLYQTEVYGKRLESAFTATGLRPIVVMQKVTTNGWRGNKWPTNEPAQYEDWNAEKNMIIRKYLADKGYTMTWENNAFLIYQAQ